MASQYYKKAEKKENQTFSEIQTRDLSIVLLSLQACIYENEESKWPTTDPDACLTNNKLDSIEIIGSDADAALADLSLAIDWSRSVAKFVI